MKNREIAAIVAKPYDKWLVFGLPSSLFDELKIPVENLQFKLVIQDNKLMLLGPSVTKQKRG